MQNLQNMYIVRAGSRIVRAGSRTSAGWHTDVKDDVKDKFPWRDLDADIQEQILQDVPQNLRRYFTDPDGGFNWRTLPPGIGAQIVRHIPRTRVDLQGVIVAVPSQQFDPTFRWFAPTLVDLSFVGSGPPQAWHALWPSRAATPLQVTFSQRLDRESLERTWGHIENHDPEEDEFVQDYYAGFPPRRTGDRLDELEAQVQRTYVWTVHAIRLIRHDGDDWQDPDFDEFSVEFVRRGALGDEVIALDEVLAVDGVTTAEDPSVQLTRAQRDELARQLTTRLGLRHRVMHELGNRERTLFWMDGPRRRMGRRRHDDPPLEHPNGEEWSV